MNTAKLLIPFFFCALCGLAFADSQWILDQSTLTDHVSHPLHQVDGVSQAARGKGVCHDGQCNFLVAAPVKSFDSGDSNRDLHMVQVTRGAQFPMVTVRTRLPASTAISNSPVRPPATKTCHSKLPRSEMKKKITGTIPSKLTDFKIDPPTLLTMPIKNDIPVKVEMTWKLQ
jgi:hypothetical protein